MECLAVVFACNTFDQYIYGKRDLTVLSDHRPLETILKKEMEKSPLRLQKMLLSLQRYGMDLEYRPGHEQVVADMLSRAAKKTGDTTGYQDTKSEVFLMGLDESDPTEYTDMSDMRLKKMKEVSSDDSLYQQLIKNITGGWPNRRDRCPHEIQNYWTFQEELAVKDGLIYRGARLVVPINMVREVCEALHQAHQSAETMLRRARDILYWPGMVDDLQKTADECRPCLLDKPKNQKETIRLHDFPKTAFAKVGTDIMYHQGKPHLIIVDYMSDFIEVLKLGDETANTVIEACKSVFARHGVPIWLQSDNAPYYTSYEFKRFTEEWQINHTTSSPIHPRSNGKAEAAVKTVKHMFKSSSDPWRALMEWRASPNRDFKSPCERLYSRKIRTLVPQPSESYILIEHSEEETAQAREHRQRRMATSYNKRSKDLNPLVHGQPVLLQTVNDRARKWRPARVLEPLSDRSYLIENDAGNVVRRNRTALQAVPANSEQQQEYDQAKTTRTQRSARSSIEPHVDQESKQQAPMQLPRTPKKTRSGRSVREPSYLSDYVH